MKKEFEIIIRDKNNNELVRQVVPDTCLIAVIQNEQITQDGWKKQIPLWMSLTDEEKSRMLAHSTFESNKDI